MKITKKFWRGLLLFILIAALCGGMAAPFLEPAQAAQHYVYPAGNIVISEFRTRGPNGAADEFVEIYNPTSSTISIAAWQLRVLTGTGTEATRATVPTGVSLAPGQYFLIANNTSGTGFSGSVTPDLTYTTGIIDDGGIAIFNGSNVKIDSVGLNTTFTTYTEGTPLAALSGTANQSYERRIGGGNGNCQDDDNNSADFSPLNPSAPQNSSSPTVSCGTPTNTPVPTIDVNINEVAWAGTRAFSGDEWIELYNAGTATADLTDWRLVAADGDPLILLSGTLSPGGYLLLERGSQNVTNIPGVVYNSASLSDTGETLYLLNATSTIVDSANSNGGGWPSGTGSPDFRSMERIGVVADTDLSWVTFAGTPTALDAGGNGINGTPGAANWGLNTTPTFTPTPSLTPTLTFTPSPTLTFTPTNTATPAGFLSLVINEVAWMGTAASSSDEWIELYNPGLTPVSLSGWILRAVDGTPLINLAGTIPARGFFLLERTDDTTVSDIVADQIYTGDLGNTGEILQLFDPGNRLIDTANSNGGGWPAGSSTTFGSMERRGVLADSDTAWITNTGVVRNGRDANNNPINGTPRQSNWAFTVTPTSSPQPTATVRPTQTRAPTAAPQPLVAINEFVPRAGRDWNNDGVVNTGDEFIEIINHGTVSVNLSGYTLDDEVNVGSSSFQLPSVTLNPGERIVFYGSQTNLLLSDGGDGVRLLKPNGELVDAYNYTVVNYPDQSFCRLPDNGGLDDWSQNCFPTPGLRNSVDGSSPGAAGEDVPTCPIADTLPLDFFLAECAPFGHNIWNRPYWDNTGWYGEQDLPESSGKWNVFVD